MAKRALRTADRPYDLERLVSPDARGEAPNGSLDLPTDTTALKHVDGVVRLAHVKGQQHDVHNLLEAECVDRVGVLGHLG